MLDDGRVLLASHGAICLLDPDTGQRTSLTVAGRQGFEIDDIFRFGIPSGAMQPLPVDRQTVLGLRNRRAQKLGILDVGKNELRIQATDVSWRSACLWSNESEAILQEEHLRLVRYDVAHDQSEVLFSVDDLD